MSIVMLGPPSQPPEHIPEGEVFNYAPDVTTLGAFAIDADAASAYHLRNVTDSSNIPEELRESVEKGWDAWHDREYELDVVRGKLAALEPYQSRALDKFMDSQDAPYLKTVREQAAPEDEEFSWVSWLTEGASNDELLNFLQWHDHMVQSQQQSEELKAEIERERTEYIAGIAKGVEEGVLHPDAAQYAIEKARSVRVLVGDFFDTHLQEQGGYHHRGTDYFVIAQGLDPKSHDGLKANVQHAFKHEMNHAVLGMLGGRIFDEALTQFIAESIDSGEWDINRKGSVYVEEINLIRMLSQQGAQEVPIELFTRAYSSNWEHNPQGRMEAVQELIDALDAAWWKGAFQDILKHEAKLGAEAEDKDPATIRKIQLETMAAIKAMLHESIRLRRQARVNA